MPANAAADDGISQMSCMNLQGVVVEARQMMNGGNKMPKRCVVDGSGD